MEVQAHPQHIRNIVIVGGGTAGWMTAAALAKVCTGPWTIKLVESQDIGTIGVGEATIPLINIYNEALELDENQFMRETQATFKLGIEFVNWGRIGDSYIHGFGPLGPDMGTTRFHQFWLKGRKSGFAAPLERYSVNTVAARSHKFMRKKKDMPNSPMGEITHAYHLDAHLYAQFLRRYAEARGVQRIEGMIQGATQNGETGFIETLVLTDGRAIEGDLFIDCSGFRGLLIEEVLKTGYEDWSHYLPMNRAWAVPCSSVEPLLPYTRATARQAGWQWRIPLQHRIGNGHVFCSDFIGEQEAADVLMANLDGKALADPRLLKFTTGKRKKLWNKNVIANGLASGFLEPMESTSIHLVQATIARLATLFPDKSFAQADVDEFNRQSDFDYEKIRDFLILHYKATERDDSPFWQRCRDMEIPASLQQKLDIWKAHGRVFRESTELFSEISWLEVLLGQRVYPRSYNPLVDAMSDDKVREFLDRVEGTIERCVQHMPLHRQYVQDQCATPEFARSA